MQRLSNWLERRRSASRGRRASKNNNNNKFENNNKMHDNKLLNNTSFDNNSHRNPDFPRGAPAYASMTVAGRCAARPRASFGAASLARGRSHVSAHLSSASSSSTTISGASSASPWREPPGQPVALRYGGESSCRMKIRTNPWLHNNNNHTNNNNRLNNNNNNNGNRNTVKTTLDRNASDFYRMTASSSSGAPSASSSTASFGQPTTVSQMLHSSTCSSGYGSQDNSPDCSVHSPDWTAAGGGGAAGAPSRRLSATGGVIVTLAGCASPIRGAQQSDEHIYHELESSNYRMHHPTDGGTLTRNTHVTSYRMPACNVEDEYFGDDLDEDEEEPLYAVPYRNSVVRRSDYDQIDGDVEDCALEADVEELSLASTSSSASTSCDSWTPMMQTSARAGQRCQPSGLSAPRAYWTPQDVDDPTSSDSSDDDADVDEDPTLATRLLIAAAAASRQRRLLPATPTSRQNFGGPAGFGGLAKIARPPAKFNVLAELDQQIVELQWQSDAVRGLVDAAKARHELRDRTRRLCMQHLHELRCCVLHNHFELCI